MPWTRTRAIRALLFFPTALAVVGPVFAAAEGAVLPPEKDSWIQIQSAHFTIFSDAPEKRALDLVRSLERFRTVLSVFHARFQIDSPQPNFVFIFRNEESFNRYKLRVDGKPAAVSGTFFSHPDANYITLAAAWNQDPRPTIYHEFTHQLLRNNLPFVPPWFNEGLAEFYSTFTADDQHASIGMPVENHLRWLGIKTLIPLRQLLDQEYSPDFLSEVTREGTFYAESWALVHYLLSTGKEHREQAGRFLDGMQGGSPVDEAFSAAFHAPLESLEAPLVDYLRNGRFIVSKVTFTDKLRVETNEKVTPLPRAEALARLGELLLHVQDERLPDAEAHFREALRLEPFNARAQAGLGTVMASRGDFAQAVSLYEKAARSRPDDPLFCYLHARALLRHKEGESSSGDAAAALPEDAVPRARELLTRAIQLRPTFAEAYVELGNLADLPGADVQQGVAALEKARQFLPSREDVAADLFLLYLKSSNRDAAQALFDKVIAPNKHEALIRWARLALQEFDYRHTPVVAERAGDDSQRPSATPPDQALFEKRQASYVKTLEEALQSTTDPESRKRLEAEIERVRGEVNLPAQIDSFNQAVARANARDYAGAIAILEKLLPQARDPELLRRIRETLASLRQQVEKSKPNHP